MQFKLTYTVSRTFEIPDGASDEEYDAMKETVITGIVFFTAGFPLIARHPRRLRLQDHRLRRRLHSHRLYT